MLKVLKVFNRFATGPSAAAGGPGQGPVEATGAPLYADDGAGDEEEEELVGRPRTLRKFR